MFKDTKDGQTHSFGDGCGEPAHNPQPTTNETIASDERIIKDFEYSFGDDFPSPVFYDHDDYLLIISFIRSALLSTRADAEAKIRKDLLDIADEGEYEELRREVERYFSLDNRKFVSSPISSTKDHTCEEDLNGYCYHCGKDMLGKK